MKKLRKLLQDSHPELMTLGCNAHYLNLLQSDVTNKSVLKHVGVHMAHGLLKEKATNTKQIQMELLKQ